MTDTQADDDVLIKPKPELMIYFAFAIAIFLTALITFVVVQENYAKPLANSLCNAYYPNSKARINMPTYVRCSPRQNSEYPEPVGMGIPMIENISYYQS